MPPLTIRTLPISELKPAVYNPRKIEPKAYKKLKTSVERFGLVEPLIWNERTGHVVGGHQRLKAVQELGYAEVPVSVVQLSDAEEKALNVVLNNLEAQGRYEAKSLSALLMELQGLPGFEDTGFELDVTKDIMMNSGEVQPEVNDQGQMEVRLKIPAETFDRLKPKLDVLVREYGIQARVRML